MNIDEKLAPVLAEVLSRNAGETEFHQAVREVLESLGRVVTKHPDYADDALIERITLVTIASYDRLIDEAANSPRVRGPGSRNQATIGAFVTYRLF